MSTAPHLLDVRGLSVAVESRRNERVVPVDGVSLHVDPGECVGIAGESGCGKSTLLRAIVGVLPRRVERSAGSVLLEGHELDPRRDAGELAMIFQDPLTGLNPVMTVGEHVMEVPRRRDGLGRAQARARAVELLREVGIDDAEHRLEAYPHQLSGGQRQRVLIAAALSGDPKVLLCDEPTTALDVTVQARFVALLRRLADERGLGIVYVTHDLLLLGTIADRIEVMYAGQVIERGSRAEVLHNPSHPYTAALLAAAPRLTVRVPRLASIPGHPPALTGAADGCRFAPRCAFAADECGGARGLGAVGEQHETACVRSSQVPTLRAGGAA
jgi:oligopeptide/dipeptide ABC transporter ATP-binding protein